MFVLSRSIQFSVKPKHLEMGTMGTIGTSEASDLSTRNTELDLFATADVDCFFASVLESDS